MDRIEFNRLDLNLLRVMEAVYRTGSVQGASAVLALTPSAVSHALARLRQAVGDPLFVRKSGALHPTPYLNTIAPEIREIMRRLEVSISAQTFDPSKTRRHFSIIGSAYMSIVFLPRVIARVSEEAPQAQISLRSSEAAIVEALDSGQCDVALGRFGRVPDRMSIVELFQERMVWVMRKNHPLLKRTITTARLRAAPRIVISVRGQRDAVDALILEAGLERRMRRDDQALLGAEEGSHIALTVPDAPTALHYVRTTDLVALLPFRLAQKFAGIFNLVTLEPPYPSPASAMSMIWHRRLGEYADAAWLRSIVQEVASQIDARVPPAQPTPTQRLSIPPAKTRKKSSKRSGARG